MDEAGEMNGEAAVSKISLPGSAPVDQPDYRSLYSLVAQNTKPSLMPRLNQADDNKLCSSLT